VLLAPADASSPYCGIVHHHKILPLGDRALALTPIQTGSIAISDWLRCLGEQIGDNPPPGLRALVPGLSSLTVHYDPRRTTYESLTGFLSAAVGALTIVPASVHQPIIIPVCYGGEFGPDLDEVAATHHTTPDAIVRTHTAGRYTVEMLGFLPGFPYLEGLDASLHTPRRATPRIRVPAGSVGIGGSSTGIYPCTSPGGWQLIGRTPRTLFDAHRTSPALLTPGDTLQFVAIQHSEFEAYERAS